MNIDELIAELQKFPGNMPVMLRTCSVWVVTEKGYREQDLDDLDSTEADSVRPFGGSVLIKGR